MRGRAIVIGCLVLGSVLLFGCEPGTNVTFKNETDVEVIIWEGRAEADHLMPGEKITYSISHAPFPTTWRLTDLEGNILFEETFTFEELRDYGDIVVPTSSPTPAPTGR